MKSPQAPILVGITGGSGAGKTWLADRLQRAFGAEACRLSLDDFYTDLTHVPRSQRASVNFDDPCSVDWALFESVLRGCRRGARLLLPRYDFSTHTRQPHRERWKPTPLVLVDGLWLFRHPRVRILFQLGIYLDCPEHVRWCRRLSRDVTERGRTPESVREQFWRTVAPMHNRVVAPQAEEADLILHEPISPPDFDLVTGAIRDLLKTAELDSRPADFRARPSTSEGRRAFAHAQRSTNESKMINPVFQIGKTKLHEARNGHATQIRHS